MPPTTPPPSLPLPGPWPAGVALHAQLWLRRLGRLRGMLALLGGSVGVIGLIALQARSDPGNPAASLDAFVGTGLPALGLCGLLLGLGTLRRDADHGALALWMLRPHAALTLPLGRVLASAAVSAATALVVFTGAGLIQWWLGRPWDAERWAVAALTLPIGAWAYTALGAALAAWTGPATALALGWWLVLDLGISRWDTALARLAIGAPLRTAVAVDLDLRFADIQGSAGPWWAALAQLLVFGAVATAALLVRMRGDVPEERG